MKKRSLLLTVVATISLTTTTMAQFPANGLVAWYPFNGNANDESGNNLNGVVDGATLIGDRFGNTNHAYSFDASSNNNILISDNSLFNTNEGTWALWMKTSTVSGGTGFGIMEKGTNLTSNIAITEYQNRSHAKISWVSGQGNSIGSTPIINDNLWHHVLITWDGSTFSNYVDGIFQQSCQYPGISLNNGQPILIGRVGENYYQTYNGLLDDIGIWNRVLTQQEITDLYNLVSCSNNLTITPQNNNLNTGNTASFSATTSDANPNYIWQSDFGQGFQTLNNYGSYSGTNTATLNISNVQLRNHNQPIRAISTSGNCIDTSNVATISISDTCINLITVTDTLIINTTLGVQPNVTTNTIKVFPNPASTHITIDYGDFSSMSGYSIKIINSLSQEVFTSVINQQTSFIDLSTWSGDGIYFVQILDSQSNVIENRKIVLQ